MTDNSLDFLQEPNATPQHRGLSLSSIVLLIGVILSGLVLAWQLANQNRLQPMPGEPARDFQLTTFDGQTVNTADLRGQIIVINFWASWCAPCREEAPDLQQLHLDYVDQGVTLIGVNWLDIEGEALAFIDEFGLTYANGPDMGEHIAEQYAIQGAPETFIIGPDGTVTHSFLGLVDYDKLAAAIDTVLAGEDAT